MSEPEPAPLAVQAPAWLSEAGRGYWADLVRHLDGDVLKPADAHAFGMLCNELATYAAADKDVQREGLLLATGPDGQGWMANPAIRIRNDAGAAVAKWSAYLRITPDDAAHRRSKVTRDRTLRHRVEQ